MEGHVLGAGTSVNMRDDANLASVAGPADRSIPNLPEVAVVRVDWIIVVESQTYFRCSVYPLPQEVGCRLT